MNPSGIASDTPGNIYISSTGDNVIRKVDSPGIITTVPGTYGVIGCAETVGGYVSVFERPPRPRLRFHGTLYVPISTTMSSAP